MTELPTCIACGAESYERGVFESDSAYLGINAGEALCRAHNAGSFPNDKLREMIVARRAALAKQPQASGEAFVPKKGQRVRIVERHQSDSRKEWCTPGSIVTVYKAESEYPHPKGFACIWPDDELEGAWLKVELVEESAPTPPPPVPLDDLRAKFDRATTARSHAHARAYLADQLTAAFPDLERLARFGLKALSFLEEQGQTCNEALDQARHAWEQRCNPSESRAHAAALAALRELLAAARALDQGNQVRAAVGAGTEET